MVGTYRNRKKFWSWACQALDQSTILKNYTGWPGKMQVLLQIFTISLAAIYLPYAAQAREKL